jgi:hypothetical protein
MRDAYCNGGLMIPPAIEPELTRRAEIGDEQIEKVS